MTTNPTTVNINFSPQMDIFIRNEDGTPFIGKVWNPETSIFPDFTHPRATEYWTRQMKRLHDMLPYDGMWIDMNEPANMVNGNKEKGCDEKNPLNKPPFMPGQDSGLTTYKKTMCPSAKQYLGSHYDLHNMYGYFEAKATYEALKTIHPKKRPYIVSRATVTGESSISIMTITAVEGS
jgi:lysosomal alpha-glucosidase